MLRTKVKAGPVTNLTDARYFAAREVEWLGFNFDPAANTFIRPEVMKAIKEWVDGVKIVGEFSLESAGEILSAIEVLELDAAQVGMFTTPETLMEIRRNTRIPIIKEIIADPASDIAALRALMEPFAALAEAFLLNLDKNGIDWAALQAGRPFSEADLRSLCEDFPILLSIDLSGSQVDEVLRSLPLYGLQVSGGEEEKVGFKSFDELDDIFEALDIP